MDTQRQQHVHSTVETRLHQMLHNIMLMLSQVNIDRLLIPAHPYRRGTSSAWAERFSKMVWREHAINFSTGNKIFLDAQTG